MTNWEKLKNFLYITAALTAALLVSLGADGPGTTLGVSLAVVIAVFGIGVSVGFTVMLRYGRHYLQARKSALTELEDRMVWHGGRRMVSRRPSIRDGEYLGVSPTGLVMMLIPAARAVCWLVIGTVLLLR